MICRHCQDPFSHDYRTGRKPKYCAPCALKLNRRDRVKERIPRREMYAAWQYPCREYVAWITRPIGAVND